MHRMSRFSILNITHNTLGTSLSTRLSAETEYYFLSTRRSTKTIAGTDDRRDENSDDRRHRYDLSYRCLSSTAFGAPSKPKVFNSDIPFKGKAKEYLNTEQKNEVDEHNREFDRKYERGQVESDDRDKKSEKDWACVYAPQTRTRAFTHFKNNC